MLLTCLDSHWMGCYMIMLYDYACVMDSYLLNREPKQFEYYMRTLVHGAHWAAMKKLSEPNQTSCCRHMAAQTPLITICINISHKRWLGS